MSIWFFRSNPRLCLFTGKRAEIGHTMSIDWNDANWGNQVHISETGSYLPERLTPDETD